MRQNLDGSSSANPISLLHHHGELVTLTFSNTTEGNRHYLRFEAERPIELSPYLTKEEWSSLKVRMDSLGAMTERNEGRATDLLIVLVPAGVCLLMIEKWRDMKHKEGLQAALFSILTFFVIILLAGFVAKLVWDEIYEVYQRRLAMFELKVTCQAYSDLLKSRGCQVELSEGAGASGHLVLLTFRKVADKEIHQL